jgi:hypothetical protein
VDDHEKIRIGICWFDEAQWSLLKKLDPEGTDDTYDDWRKSASSLFYELREAGQDVIKVAVKTNKLLAWCEERDLKPVQSSRSEYTAYLLEQR